MTDSGLVPFNFPLVVLITELGAVLFCHDFSKGNMFGNFDSIKRSSQNTVRTETGILNLKVRLFFALLVLCAILTILVWHSDAASIVFSPKNRKFQSPTNSFLHTFAKLHQEGLNAINDHGFNPLSPNSSQAILSANRSKLLDNPTEKALDSLKKKQLATQSKEQSGDGKLLGIVNMTVNITMGDEMVIQGKSSDNVITKETDKYLASPSKTHSQPLDDKQCNSSLDPSCMYGRCITGTNHILLYNRVPKCGSRTFLSLAEVLASKNGFHKPRETTDGNTIQITLRRRLMNMPLGSLLHGHIKFIDFKNDTRLPEKKRPIYINIIRDPIDRLVSQYYFVRYGDGLFTNKRRLKKLQKNIFLNETLNDCVERGRPECLGSPVQVQYFCGYHPDCQHPEEAFQRAVRNLDYYLVVGIAEEYEDYLKVLEKLLPDYFKGVVEEYNTPAERIRKAKSSAKKKQPPTEAVRDKLRSLLDMEYKFYYHVRSKFQGLKQKLGIG